MFRRIARRSPAIAAALVAALLLAAVPATAAPPPAGASPPTVAQAATGPITSANARFIADRYRLLLGREPDTAGLDFHLARLASGGATTRQAFVYALLFGVEGSRTEVTRAYADLLDRAADPSGHTYWTAHLQGHGVVDLRVLLLASEEYRNRAGGTDEAWIRSMYLDVLGREPEAAGLAYWVGRAGAGVPRPLIAAAILQSDEALARRVIAHHLDALGRHPSSAERTAGVATIRSSGERGLRAELLASDEAFQPFLEAALS